MLVTGGTGALGSAVAGWLPARGVRRLILASRSGAATPAVRLLIAGPAFGAVVTVVRADVGTAAEAQDAVGGPIQAWLQVLTALRRVKACDTCSTVSDNHACPRCSSLASRYHV